MSLCHRPCYAANVSYRYSIDKSPFDASVRRRLWARINLGQHKGETDAAVTCRCLRLAPLSSFAQLSGFAYTPHMSTDLSTPVLLRRIAQLETTVGRLSEDLGSLRSAVGKQGLQLPRSRGLQARVAQAKSTTTDNQDASATGGLAGATARGEAARVQWVKDGLVVPGEQLAQAWGLTRQALAPAAERGEVFAVKVGNRLYYPRSFLGMDRETVATVCRALGDLGSSEKLIFWLRDHGTLAGKSVAAALEAGVPVAKVECLAAAWARERGAARVSAAA